MWNLLKKKMKKRMEMAIMGKLLLMTLMGKLLLMRLMGKLLLMMLMTQNLGLHKMVQSKQIMQILLLLLRNLNLNLWIVMLTLKNVYTKKDAHGMFYNSNVKLLKKILLIKLLKKDSK